MARHYTDPINSEDRRAAAHIAMIIEVMRTSIPCDLRIRLRSAEEGLGRPETSLSQHLPHLEHLSLSLVSEEDLTGVVPTDADELMVRHRSVGVIPTEELLTAVLLPLRASVEPGEIATGGDCHPSPELWDKSIEKDRSRVVITIGTERLSNDLVVLPMGHRTASLSTMNTGTLRARTTGKDPSISRDTPVHGTKRWCSKGREDNWVRSDLLGDPLPAIEACEHEHPCVHPVTIGTGTPAR